MPNTSTTNYNVDGSTRYDKIRGVVFTLMLRVVVFDFRIIVTLHTVVLLRMVHMVCCVYWASAIRTPVEYIARTHLRFLPPPPFPPHPHPSSVATPTNTPRHTLRFRVEDLDLPERRKRYTSGQEEEDVATHNMCPCGTTIVGRDSHSRRM